MVIEGDRFSVLIAKVVTHLIQKFLYNVKEITQWEIVLSGISDWSIGIV